MVVVAGDRGIDRGPGRLLLKEIVSATCIMSPPHGGVMFNTAGALSHSTAVVSSRLVSLLFVVYAHAPLHHMLKMNGWRPQTRIETL